MFEYDWCYRPCQRCGELFTALPDEERVLCENCSGRAFENPGKRPLQVEKAPVDYVCREGAKAFDQAADEQKGEE